MMEILGLLLRADDFVNLANRIDIEQDAESLIEMLLYVCLNPSLSSAFKTFASYSTRT